METNVECKMQRLDTVGAVAVDKDGCKYIKCFIIHRCATILSTI